MWGDALYVAQRWLFGFVWGILYLHLGYGSNTAQSGVFMGLPNCIKLGSFFLSCGIYRWG